VTVLNNTQWLFTWKPTGATSHFSCTFQTLHSSTLATVLWEASTNSIIIMPSGRRHQRLFYCWRMFSLVYLHLLKWSALLRRKETYDITKRAYSSGQNHQQPFWIRTIINWVPIAIEESKSKVKAMVKMMNRWRMLEEDQPRALCHSLASDDHHPFGTSDVEDNTPNAVIWHNNKRIFHALHQ